MYSRQKYIGAPKNNEKNNKSNRDRSNIAIAIIEK